MPYSKDSPPAKIAGLPEHAKSIWISAFNSALEQYKDEKKAHAVAWSAVEKAGYHKDKDGNWTKSGESMSTSNNLAEIEQRKDVNPERGKTEYGNVEFADEKNKKYPIDTAEHIHAAWNYINHPDNAAKYSAGDVAAIKAKIVRAWKSKISKDGPPSAKSESLRHTVYHLTKIAETPKAVEAPNQAEIKEALNTTDMPMYGMTPNKPDEPEKPGEPEEPEPKKEAHSHPHEHDDGTKHEHLHEHLGLHGPETAVAHQHDHPDGLQVKKSDSESAKKIRTMYINESLVLNEAIVDKKKGEIDVTVIKQGWSDNNRYYSADLLERSAKLLDGARAFGDHATPESERQLPERSIWEQVGYYTNPRYVDAKIKATLKLIGDTVKKNHILEWADECVKTGQSLMGLSINALGKTEVGEAEGRKGVIVAEIASFNSADIVTRPAAGGAFNQILASGDEFTADLLNHLEYDEWRECRPDFIARLKNEMKTARKEELESLASKKAQELELKLSEQIEILKSKDEKITELIDKANGSKKELADRVQKYELAISEATTKEKLIESKISDLTNEKNVLTERVQKYELSMSDAAVEEKSLKAKIAELSNEANKSKQELSEQQQKYELAVSESATTGKLLESKIGDLTNEAKRVKQELADKVHEYETHINEVLADKNLIESRVIELETEVNRVKQELVDRNKEFELRMSEVLADKKLLESKLPKEFVDSLRPHLVGKTPAEMDSLINVERIKFFSVKEPIPVNNPPTIERKESVHQFKMGAISRELGVDVNSSPLPAENYEEWRRRTKGK